MLKKWKGILSVFICVLMLCTVMPITGHAADNAASVTFGGNTENYTTIDAAWTAAVALDTTAENKATIKLLTNCKTENTLTNTADYLVLDTNGKTLTTPDAIHNENNILCGISVEGGNLEIIGNGTITGLSSASYARGILRITGGEAYANGVTIHNTGLNGSNAVVVNGGSFHLLDGYLLSDSEYALDALSGKVYLYSGKIESTGRLAAAFDYSLSNVQICYSDKPLYFVDNDTNNWSVISNVNVQLADNLIMDLEYSDNPDGSDSKTLKNVTEIDTTANTDRNYLKIQTYKPSYLFSTNYNSQLLKKIKNDGVTALTEDAFTAVHFVDLADYDMTNITYSDYSSKNDGSVKAWVNGTELYIGGYGKIIAGRSLSCALRDGKKIDSITGLELLDTSKTTDMGYLFNYCGSESTVFTLDLGDGFDTSKVTDMTYMFLYCGKNSTKFALNLGKNFDTSNVTKMGSMFYGCGYSSPTFTLNLGDKFDTSKVTYMYQMFQYCGKNSKAFTTLDLSTFTVGADTTIDWFADSIPVTKFIFGKGWRNAALPAQYTYFARCSSNTPTEIVGATKNLLSYDWTRDNRTVTFTDNTTYTITPAAEDGGTVSGGGTVLDGESITLTAAANNGYSFDGWYDGDTKVCDTEKFVIEDAADDKTYTAKFATYYTVSAEVSTGGGTVSGGGKVAKGTSITLTATANEGYTFDGWYDGDTKVCETEEFVVNNVTADKTYTAKFTRNVSRLFDTSKDSTLLSKIKSDGTADVSADAITDVHFVDLAERDLTDVTYSDYSADGDGSVKAWMDGTELYIGGNGKIIAGDSLAYAFYNGSNIYSIAGLEMLDTSNTKNMSYMFALFGGQNGIFKLDLGDDFDTSNVTDMSGMFYSCGQGSKFTLDLGNKFDTSKVTDMSAMFYRCGFWSNVFTLDLGIKFDTSNVTNMSRMFYSCGNGSTEFTLNLGDKFDTSKVTDMSTIFYNCGQNSKVFTLDLGDKFNTLNVTNMSHMFEACGYGSTVFTLNLGDKFDTSKVTKMSGMFRRCGRLSNVFTLDLGNKFDTSNVTGMSDMFYECGYSNEAFTLDLGDKFDTSKVTGMEDMFYECGYSSKVFTLDLGDKFDTINVTNMNGMFYECGYSSGVFTLDLGDKFDTSKVYFVGGMDSMFYRCGYSSKVFTLDLGDKFNTPKVTDMTSMFYECGNQSSAFTTLDLSSFTIKADTDITNFAQNTPITTFIFGDGWANATLPSAGSSKGAFYADSQISTTVTGATENLLNYDWASDNRTVTFPDKKYYTITALADDGGTVSGGGTVIESSSITLTATADDGYTFAGWYDGETKVCDTAEFVVSNVTADKIYTAKFTKNAVSYTISAEVDANGGGTVSGGGEVAAGGSITLTATVNDGYTFAGWYDGDTKVCDTAEFVVTNVAADKTYTAKFTKNQVAPEPEKPEIPYLKWDGSTLTLVKKTSASCRVGIVYVGGATFDADNINWDKLVSVGKEYANLNSAVGYAVYSNFTKRTPGTRGNYVAFVKYTKDDGTTTADYITFNVKDAVSFEIPSLSYNVKTKTLKLTGDVSSTIGVAYVGDAEFNASNLNWNDFIKAGKQYTDVNGSSGYAKVLNTLDYTKTFTVNGNYVAFVKYNDENINKTLAKYYTFTVSDYEPQPEDVPYVSAQDNKIVLAASRLEVAKVTIAYIGTDDIYITNWSEFSAAAAKFSDINGKALNQQYTNPKDGSAWKQKLAGWYAVYIRYIKDGEKCNSYYTVELN